MTRLNPDRPDTWPILPIVNRRDFAVAAFGVGILVGVALLAFVELALGVLK